jgi:UDP-GlcNAc3NAcA epimerase
MNDSPLPVFLPLHPRTRKVIERECFSMTDRVRIIEPLSYRSILGYLEKCVFVITDSGGLQKESYFFGKKCLTVRDETEWTELVECGANRVVGADQSVIRSAFSWAMKPLKCNSELYGKGDAGKRIVHELLQAK